jgi:hypothetical protein
MLKTYNTKKRTSELFEEKNYTYRNENKTDETKKDSIDLHVDEELNKIEDEYKKIYINKFKTNEKTSYYKTNSQLYKNNDV